MRYLVDTDWVIHYLNGETEYRSRLDALAYEGVAVSMISLAEVYHGIYRSLDSEGEERAFLRFLAGCDVLGLNDQICRIFGRERGRLQASGTPIGDFDLLIGCTAIFHGLTVLTDNRRHFDRIEGIEIFSV